MIELVHQTDPHAITDNIGGLSDDQGVVIGQVVGDKAVVGTGELKGKCCLLVHIMVQKYVLTHTKTFTDTKVVE